MNLTLHSTANQVTLAVCGMVFLPAFAYAQAFEIVDLGEAQPAAISENNTIVGELDGGAFAMCDGCFPQDLELLPNAIFGGATAISPNGMYITGYSINIAQGPSGLPERSYGVAWFDGQFQRLNLLRPDGAMEPQGVNDDGQVVGNSYANYVDHRPFDAFIWQNGVTDFLTNPYAPDDRHWGRAFDINNNGQAVGHFRWLYLNPASPYELSEPTAFLWSDGVRHNLASLPGHAASGALAVNEHGQAVGWSGASVARGGPGNWYPLPDWTHAVLWEEGIVHDLGTLPDNESSQALAINDYAQIVGWSGSMDGSTTAALWQCDQTLDLNTLLPRNTDWELLEARDINNNGWIVGVGLKEGELKGFALKPRGSASTPGAEPANSQGGGRPLCPGSQGQGRK